MVRQLLPAEVKSALIEVCGRAFWYKEPLFDMLARSGIPEEMYLRYEHEPKFKIARQLLRDLEAMEEDGYLLQRRLLTELCKLRNLPDTEVPDRDAGLNSLRRLKQVAGERKLIAEEEKIASARRKTDAEVTTQKARERERKLRELHAPFLELSSSPDRQGRGDPADRLPPTSFLARLPRRGDSGLPQRDLG